MQAMGNQKQLFQVGDQKLRIHTSSQQNFEKSIVRPWKSWRRNDSRAIVVYGEGRAWGWLPEASMVGELMDVLVGDAWAVREAHHLYYADAPVCFLGDFM